MRESSHTEIVLILENFMCQESYEQLKFLCSTFTFSLNHLASDLRLYKYQLSINFSLTCKGVLDGEQTREGNC